MELISIAYFSIAVLYSSLIIWFIVGTYRIKSTPFLDSNHEIQFSIIIPFRNEEVYLPKLLKSLKDLEYPNTEFEVLFVDDESTDSSVDCIQSSLKDSNIHYRIIPNSRNSLSPKKDAIQSAINKANSNWILTTDADCILPKNWLQAYEAHVKMNSDKLIAGPVQLIFSNSFVQKFQALEFGALQTATIGGFGWNLPFLSNGANLCFEKKTFEQLSGYEGNNHIASGDDIFLLEKCIKNQIKTGFLKSHSAVVLTHPQLNWKATIRQRIRWASKTKNYQLKRAKIFGAIIFLMNTSLVIGVPLTTLNYLQPSAFLSIFMVKLFIDYFSMLNQTNGRTLTILPSYIGSSILYPIISVYIVFRSYAKSYIWKGRVHKN